MYMYMYMYIVYYMCMDVLYTEQYASWKVSVLFVVSKTDRSIIKRCENSILLKLYMYLVYTCTCMYVHEFSCDIIMSAARGAVSSAALRGLLCLSEVSTTSSGGMAELVRNDVFPSIDEITAVALQFGALPGTSAGAVLKCVPEQMHSTTVAGSHTPAAACDGEREEKTKLKVPLDMQNSDYEKLLGDRKGQPPVDYINKNIVSDIISCVYVYGLQF